MNRGYALIALHNPKTPANVGAVLRAAFCYGVAQVAIGGERGRCAYNKMIRSGTNTPQAHRHIPVYTGDDPLAFRPVDSQVVAVDLLDGATPLPNFQHPQRAIYVFGPEDGTLGRFITDRAQHIISVPTRVSMNLAATVNVVLYDRAAKGDPFGVMYPQPDRSSFYKRRSA